MAPSSSSPSSSPSPSLSSSSSLPSVGISDAHKIIQNVQILITSIISLLLWLSTSSFILFTLRIELTNGFLFYPNSSTLGYLAAVAIPLDLPNKNVFMSFNFEANYGVPSNNSYYIWIDRWNLTDHYLGIGNNVTNVNGRQQFRSFSDEKYSKDMQQQQQHQQYQHQYRIEREREQQRNSLESQKAKRRYTRNTFYRSFIGYTEYFEMNGTGCLLRTICEVAESTLEENNGVLGSIFKVLFMPTASIVEPEIDALDSMEKHTSNVVGDGQELDKNVDDDDDDADADMKRRKYRFNVPRYGILYEAEHSGRNANCQSYFQYCPNSLLNMITQFI